MMMITILTVLITCVAPAFVGIALLISLASYMLKLHGKVVSIAVTALLTAFGSVAYTYYLFNAIDYVEKTLG